MNINSTQSNSTYTNAAYSSKGFSGMYSGLDTESLVKSMLSGIQTKIDKQNQSKQVLTWKQDFYRDIIKDVNSFQAKFLDLTSNTSLRLNAFFNTIKTSSSSSAVSVSAQSGATDTEFSMQVARLATATSVTSKAAGSGKIEFTPNAEFKYDRTVNIKLNGTDLQEIDLEGVSSAEDICNKINSVAGSDFAKVKYEYKDADGKKLTYDDVNDKYTYKDGSDYDGDVNDVTKTAVGIEFNSDEEFEISGSSAGLSILGLSGKAKSAAEKDSDGTVIGNKLETKSVNPQFSEVGKVNGTVDVTLDGVKKTISIAEGQDIDDFKEKVQKAFGTSVIFEPDSTDPSKLNISVKGSGRNITISANADTMKALGFSDGTTTVSNQTLRSDKVGKLIGADPDDTTEREFEINGSKITFKASDSISSIINKVNSSGAGVKMTYNDLNNTFKIESTSTGEGYDINVNDDTGLFAALGFEMNGTDFDPGNVSKGKNAVVNINGVSVERASNNFSYNGISISLNSTTGDYVKNSSGEYELDADGKFKTVSGLKDNAAEIKTSRDTDKVVETLKSFVEEYNTMIEKLNKLTHQKATYKKYPPLTDAQKKEMSEKEIELWEEKSKEGLLRNDRDISRFLSDMRSAMYSGNGSGIVLSNIGIDASSNWQEFGKLSIDEDKLKKALETNAEAIQKLFTGENGLASKLNKACSDLANTSSGKPGALVSIAGVVGKGTEKSNEIQSKLDSITKKLESLNMLYEKRKARYWKQFNAMETSLSNMDSQSSWLSNFMSY